MADELMSGGAPTSGQDPTAAGAATPTTPRGQGPATVPQAGDAGAAERSGTDGGRRSPSGDPQQDEGLTREEALAALKAARAEAAEQRRTAAEHKRKAQELDELKRELENAKLSENERLQKQYAEAQQQIELLRLERQEIALRSRVDTAAHDLGIKPELALRLLNHQAIEYNDDGFPTNIQELLQQAIEDFGIVPASRPAPAAGQALPPGQPGVVARATPALPALGATNPPRGGAPTGQPFVRSLDNITWKRG